MKDDLKNENLHKSESSLISRRRLLKLMGTSTVGIAGSSILTACWPISSPSKTGEGIPTSTATPVGTVTTNIGGTRPFVPYFLGYNNVPTHSPSWTNPDVVNAAKQLKPGTLRYPGGTIANFWDWQNGWLLPGAPVGSTTHSIFRLQELQSAVQATNAKPIYVLNMLTSDLNTQLDMLRTAKGMGLPVEFVELGNEFYLSTPDDYVKTFPTGREYGTMATRWLNAIHAEFPNAKVAAVGSAPASQFGNARKANWNQDMLQTLQGVDSITFHPYVPIPDGVVALGAPSDSVSKLVEAISARWQQFENLIQSLPSSMNIWLTEYNLVSANNVFYTWIHGVIVAQMTLSYLSEPRTELVCFYDMIGKTGNEVIYYSQSGGPLAPFAPTAAGWVMRLLGDTMQGMNSAQPLSLNSSSASSALIGWFFTHGSQHRAFIVNSASQSFTWNVNITISPGQAHYQQLTSDPFKIITDAGSLNVNAGTLRNQLVLPAYSVTQLQLTAP